MINFYPNTQQYDQFFKRGSRRGCWMLVSRMLLLFYLSRLLLIGCWSCLRALPMGEITKQFSYIQTLPLETIAPTVSFFKIYSHTIISFADGPLAQWQFPRMGGCRRGFEPPSRTWVLRPRACACVRCAYVLVLRVPRLLGQLRVESGQYGRLKILDTSQCSQVLSKKMSAPSSR